MQDYQNQSNNKTKSTSKTSTHKSWSADSKDKSWSSDGKDKSTDKSWSADNKDKNWSVDKPTSKDKSWSSDSASTDMAKAADDVAEQVKKSADQVMTAAKETVQELAEPLKDKALDMAKEQKDAGADHLRMLARAMDSASQAVQGDVPQLANYIKTLSGKLEQVSSDIRDQELDQLGQTASDFAKRNPALVFGGAMLAGIALTRFLKSSSQPSTSMPRSTTGMN